MTLLPEGDIFEERPERFRAGNSYAEWAAWALSRPDACPPCGSCGLMERDVRLHSETCFFRQERERRCEEAVDEWDGPQRERGESRAPAFNSDEDMLRYIREETFQRVVHPERFGVAPAPTSSYGISPLQEVVGIPLENGYLALPSFETRHQPGRPRAADLTVHIGPIALPPPCEQCGASPYTADRFHAPTCPVFRAWDSERQEEQRRRRRFHRLMARQERRYRAKRALRTMFAPYRSVLLDLVATTAIAIIFSLWIQGAFPVDAWIGLAALVTYAVWLHLWLGWRFWQAYKRAASN